MYLQNLKKKKTKTKSNQQKNRRISVVQSIDDHVRDFSEKWSNHLVLRNCMICNETWLTNKRKKVVNYMCDHCTRLKKLFEKRFL